PKEWQATQAASAVAAGALAASGSAAAPVPAPEPNVAWETLEAQEYKPGARGFTVPAKAGGWVRMGWKAEDLGPKLMSIDLVTRSSVGAAPGIHLEAIAIFVAPVRVLPDNKEQSVGTLLAGDRPRETWFTIYSSTRDRFTL